MFTVGGVFDEDKDEETLESHFYNDLFAYNYSGNGRWTSLNLKKAKANKQRRRKAKPTETQPKPEVVKDEDESSDSGSESDTTSQLDRSQQLDGHAAPAVANGALLTLPASTSTLPTSAEPEEQISPCARYNSMLAISRNVLYL